VKCHLWDGVLIAATTSWSTSIHHCSTAFGDAFGSSGLLRSARAARCVALVPAADGGRALALCSSCRNRSSDATTRTTGSPRPGARSNLLVSLLLTVGGTRRGGHGTNVHHGVEAGTPRMTKSPPT
jgi:hypothetical protein